MQKAKWILQPFSENENHSWNQDQVRERICFASVNMKFVS